MTAPTDLSDRRFRRTLRAARRGDQTALRSLWASYAGPVTGFLRARGTPEVDEVVNDVFVAAFEGLDSFAGGAGDFRSWLFAIARNKRVDRLRREARQPSMAGSENIDRASADSVEELALQAIQDAELVEILEALTSDQRDVIVLRFVLDLSLDQTAAALGKPVGAVKALQHRSIAQLRKKMLRDPYPPPAPPTM